MLLLRITKRRTSWEPGTAFEDTLRAEFRTKQGSLDLRLSVYEVEDAADIITRTYAEHAAGAGLNPPRGATNMNLRCAEQCIVQAPGASSFRFTREAHRELLFSNDSALREFVQHMHDELESRQRKTTLEQLKEFVRARLISCDPEWTEHCGRSPQWGKLGK